MAIYKVELTKKIMRDYTIEVPDHVPDDEARDWIGENVGDIWDVDELDGTAEWDGVDDLQDGEVLKVTVDCDSEIDEFDLEGCQKQ